MAYNELAYPYFIYPGQTLKLPAEAAPQATPTFLPPSPTPTQAATQIETYTVQPGEYLVALAKRFNMDWRTLAELNGIGFPYVVTPGQVLRLR